MAKNSIGQFIAALRKANGMTQQEVADRLNVSNKAVSRWERDECAPDLTLIPALAEMFGVSCDELLRGERTASSQTPEQAERKTQKQINAIVGRTVNDLNNMCMLSFALALVGFIVLLAISYGFYRPVIGFAVMSIFEIGACITEIFALRKAKSIRSTSELFDSADDSVLSALDNTLAKLSFPVFFSIAAIAALSLPFILVRSDYGLSVITLHTYLSVFLFPILAALALAYPIAKKLYFAYITMGTAKLMTSENISECNKMTALQLTFTALAGIIFVLAPYLLEPYSESNMNIGDLIYTVAVIIALLLIAANAVCFVIFSRKYRSQTVIVRGLRNLFLSPCALILSKLHSVAWTGDASIIYNREDIYHMEYMAYALIFAAIVVLTFRAIEAICKKRDSEN